MIVIILGMMKTYWLEGRQHRTPLFKNIHPPLPSEETLGNGILFDGIEERKSTGYSPVTFKELARRSIANSPVKYAPSTRGNVKLNLFLLSI